MTLGPRVARFSPMDPVHVTPPTPDCAEASTKKTPWGKLRARLRCYVRDVDAVLEHDPAARSKLEIVLTYPGLHAIWMHRVAHSLWKRELGLPARMVSHANRFLSGVEIHPGAKLGQGVFIDHGMGVVIGETAKVGDGCVLYKGVVLGGTSMGREARHPELGAKVVVGSNACILGHIQVGDGARIGSGSVVIRPVPQNGTVVGVPGRVVKGAGETRSSFDVTLDHANLPDPVSEMIRHLRAENERLATRLEKLEAALSLPSQPPPSQSTGHLINPDLATADLPAAGISSSNLPSGDLPPQHGG